MEKFRSTRKERRAAQNAAAKRLTLFMGTKQVGIQEPPADYPSLEGLQSRRFKLIRRRGRFYQDLAALKAELRVYNGFCLLKMGSQIYPVLDDSMSSGKQLIDKALCIYATKVVQYPPYVKSNPDARRGDFSVLRSGWAGPINYNRYLEGIRNPAMVPQESYTQFNSDSFRDQEGEIVYLPDGHIALAGVGKADIRSVAVQATLRGGQVKIKTNGRKLLSHLLVRELGSLPHDMEGTDIIFNRRPMGMAPGPEDGNALNRLLKWLSLHGPRPTLANYGLGISNEERYYQGLTSLSSPPGDPEPTGWMGGDLCTTIPPWPKDAASGVVAMLVIFEGGMDESFTTMYQTNLARGLTTQTERARRSNALFHLNGRLGHLYRTLNREAMTQISRTARARNSCAAALAVLRLIVLLKNKDEKTAENLAAIMFAR